MTGAANTGIDRDFAEKALADAGQWTRFADPKALAALALLGLGLANLLVLRPQGTDSPTRERGGRRTRRPAMVEVVW